MTCAVAACRRAPACAIRTTMPPSKQGLVHQLFQFPEDAPKGSAFYCIPHGMEVMAGLVRLSDADDTTRFEVTR